jgi:Exostosin family
LIQPPQKETKSWLKRTRKSTEPLFRKRSYLPLGYGPGFWEGGKEQPSPASDREYVWSFSGMVRRRPTREAMVNNMKKIPDYFFLETSDWGRRDPQSLTVSECRELMLKTIFVPCPGGWANMDSFRVYESLECGCIPIVERFPLDYFGNFFSDHPFIVVDCWEEIPDIIQAYSKDPEALEKKRLECYT